MAGLVERIYEEAVRLLFKAYLGTVHRIRIEGMENVPKNYEKLIVVANHASLIDGIIIWTYMRLPFRIVVDRTAARRLVARPFVRNRRIVLIDSMNPYSLKEVIHQVREGHPLLIFPEGRMTLTGTLMKVYEGTGFVAMKTEAGILPVYLRNTYRTIFAKKHPGRRFLAPLTMTIGKVRKPINLDHIPRRARKKAAAGLIFGDLCEVYLEAHNKPSTLGMEFIRKCRENGGKLLYSDVTREPVSYRKALSSAFALGRLLSRQSPGKNVGIMLPNLTVTALIFMGLQIFRKVPAFLNYSGGSQAIGHAMDLADLDFIVTSRRFLERIHLPETIFAHRQVVFIEDLENLVTLRDRLLALFRSVFPGSYGRLWPEEHKETACILFTSGSEGVPKGVCLSHENIITNVYQALSRIDVTEKDYFLSALPIFHSFGLTIGVIIPLFANAKAFLYITPLHYRLVPEIAYQEGCTVLCGTNTFLNGYGKKAHPYDLHSVRYVFCGAEALSDNVFDRYAKTFGVRVMSGYGATECSPIVSINSAIEHEYGTVGKVVPGLEYRIMPVEGIDSRNGTTGRLVVRGKNVMKGYLKNEAANRKYLVEDQGWYDTGDIVEITETGYLKIVDRLKRFAKISGEMVSLTALEEALSGQFGERRDLAVINVQDEHKGEKLILVTNNQDVELKVVRQILRLKGFSELAFPGEIVLVKELPKLGTGKVNYPALKGMLQTAHEDILNQT